MTIITDLLLALALSVDSLAVSTSCALKTKMPYTRGLTLAVTFGIFQGSMPLLGVLLGNTLGPLVESVDHWIAFALLAIVGGKMVFDGFKDSKDKSSDITSFGIICLLALATSIDAFVVGIGFGLKNTLAESIFTCIIIAIVTFVLSTVGIFLGKRDIPIPERWSSIIAGCVLIGLGTHTLLEHLL